MTAGRTDGEARRGPSLRGRDVAASIAVGLAVAVPWLGFLDLGIVSQLGLDPEACETNDYRCAVTQPPFLVTVASILAAGAAYGLAARRRTGRGPRWSGPVVGAAATLFVSLVAYADVAANPILDAVHGRLGVGIDELTPWVGIAEAFGIAVFLAALVVVLAVGFAVRSEWPLRAALAAGVAAAAAFVGVVVLVDPVLGIRLGVETAGQRVMPWTGLVGNLAAGTAGGIAGLALMRARDSRRGRV